MKDFKLINLVRETISVITEAKTPSEQAHELGLTHVGYGYWADESGKVVARTKDGKLLKLEKPEDIPDYADSDEEDDLTSKEIDQQGNDALQKLTDHLIGLLEIPWNNTTTFILVRNAIGRTLIHGKVPLWTPIYDKFSDQDDLEEFKDALEGLAKSKNKVVRRATMMLKQKRYQGKKPSYNPNKPVSGEPDPSKMSSSEFTKAMHSAMGFDNAYFDSHDSPPGAEPEDDVYGYPAPTPSTDTAPTWDTNLNFDKINDILNIGPEYPKYDQLLDIIKFMDNATTGAQLNYAKKKFNALDLYGEGNNTGKGSQSWDRWKALSKYVKSVKPEYKIGAANPGKIKGKKNAAEGTGVSEETLESIVPEITDKFLSMITYSDAHTNIKEKLNDIIANYITSPPGSVSIDYNNIDPLLKAAFFSYEISRLSSLINKIRDKHPQFVNTTGEQPSDSSTDEPIDQPGDNVGSKYTSAPDDLITGPLSKFVEWYDRTFPPDIRNAAFKAIKSINFNKFHGAAWSPAFTRQLRVALANAFTHSSLEPIYELEKQNLLSSEEATKVIDELTDGHGFNDDVSDNSEEIHSDDTPSGATDQPSNPLSNITQFVQALDDSGRMEFIASLANASNAKSFEEFTGEFKDKTFGFDPSISKFVESALIDYWNSIAAHKGYEPAPENSDIESDDESEFEGNDPDDDSYDYDAEDDLFTKAHDAFVNGGDVSSVLQSPEPTPEDGVGDTPEQTPKSFEWEPTSKYELAGTKAAHTAMNPDKWAKGDPTIVLNWIKNKAVENDSVGLPSDNWKAAAMELVKSFGLDPQLVPDELVPDSAKEAFDQFKNGGQSVDSSDVFNDEFNDDFDTSDNSPEPEVVDDIPTPTHSARNVDPTSPKYNPPTVGDDIDDSAVYKEIQKLQSKIHQLEQQKAAADVDPNKFKDAAQLTIDKVLSVDPELKELFDENHDHIMNALISSLQTAVPIGSKKDPATAYTEFKNAFAPQVTEKLKDGEPNPNGIPGFTYEMYRHFAEVMKTDIGKMAQGGGVIDIQIDDLKDQIKGLHENQSAQETMKKMPKFDDGTPEPPTNENINSRVTRVLRNWAKTTGFGINHLPGNGTVSKERDSVVSTVYKALSEPDPSKVLNHVGDLFTTSLHDNQILDLMKQVHRERKHPGAKVNVNGTKPTTQQTAVPSKKPYDRIGKVITAAKIPPQYKEQVRDLFNKAFDEQSAITGAYELRNNLLHLKIPGLSIPDISKMVTWFKKSKVAGYHPNPPKMNDDSGTEGENHNIPALANVSSTAAKKVLVSGEKVNTYSGYGVNVPFSNGWPPNLTGASESEAVQEAKKQHAALEQNFTKGEVHTFNTCANEWQSHGQYMYHSRDQRRKNNKIFTRVIEGPPPAEYKPARGYLERGINMTENEMQVYLQAFEIGKLAYLGPSGFSENPGKARAFGKDVVLRVYPSKTTGTINAIAVHGRDYNSDGYSTEREVVVGARRNLRVRDVIKHVNTSSGEVNYEIIMDQEDEGINESLIREGIVDDTDSYGFKSWYWKGLSKDTIKLLIKYNNSSIGPGAKK